MISSWPLLLFSAVVAALAGAIASVTGFGIGSLVTPLLALRMGTKLAVAAVSIPHFFGTALRFAKLRRHVDRRVFWRFGLTSAAGGLVGALSQSMAQGPLLRMVFGGLLIFAGVTGLTGLAGQMRLGRRTAWVAGALSGFLGGLVGNQGGIRSAAMLGFEVPKEAFVATATAAALMVDGARMPVYLVTQGREIVGVWPVLVASTIGVLAGTLVGARILAHVPESVFRRVVSALVLILGIAMIVGVGG